MEEKKTRKHNPVPIAYKDKTHLMFANQTIEQVDDIALEFKMVWTNRYICLTQSPTFKYDVWALKRKFNRRPRFVAIRHGNKHSIVDSKP